MNYSDFRFLEVKHVANGVLVITINCPDAMNATNARLHWELTKIWAVVHDDPETKVAVITGAGDKAFSAGGDLEWISSMVGDAKAVAGVMQEAADIVYNMLAFEKPIISAINGVAVGAGLAVALLADISIMAETARITDGHVRLGVAAGDHAAIIWPILCGMAKAKYYLMTAEFIDGREAERIGLVSLCAPADKLMDKAMEVADKLARGSQQAIRFTKKSLNNWLRMAGPAFDYSLALEMLCFLGEDAAHGVAAVRDKHAPRFPPPPGRIRAGRSVVTCGVGGKTSMKIGFVRCIAASLLWSTAVLAADLRGVITNTGGQPVAGAFVTARQAARRMAMPVVSDGAGVFLVPDLFPETYDLHAARFGYTPVTVAAFSVAPAGASRDFQLTATADTSDQVPGYAWIAALPDSPYKARFITGCTICHDVGAKAVRTPRDQAAWAVSIQMMRERLDIYSVIPDVDNDELAHWLVEYGFGERAAAIALPDPGADATAACVITEYDVGGIDTWAHDMAIEPATGAAWVGDYPFDELIRVDPRTGAQQRFPLPVKGAGAHTLHFDSDGILWITLQLTDMVARFDPASGAFRIYGGFQKGSLIHSFAYDEHGLVHLDSAGRIWLSEFGANSIASLDPETGAIEEYRLPGDSGHTYGIALDSQDRVWYTKYMENTFGMFDPATGQMLEKQMPRPDSAPHRMTIDTQDRLWIPNSGYGTLAMYDIAKDALEEYALPEPDTFPYAARYDGASGTVWVLGNGANCLYRFDPATERFDRYRMPSRHAYGRMIAFDYASGDVWTSLSNYPTKHTGRDSGTLVRFQRVAPPQRQ